MTVATAAAPSSALRDFASKFSYKACKVRAASVQNVNIPVVPSA